MTDLLDQRDPNYSTKRERQARESLSEAAYSRAFDDAKTAVVEGPKLRAMINRQADRINELETLEPQTRILQGSVRELRDKIRKLQSAVPARAAGAQKKTDGLKLLSVAIAAKFIGQARGVDAVPLIDDLLPGDQRKTARGQATRILKAATGVADTTSPGWASELVSVLTRDFWRDAQAVSVFASLQELSPPMRFDGASQVSIPLRPLSSEGQMAPSWVAENGLIPVVRDTLGAVMLSRYKLASISSYTNELASASNNTQNIIRVIRQSLVDDLIVKMDLDLLDGANATVERPAGLLAGAPSQVTAGNALPDILTDLRWLKSQLTMIRTTVPALLLHPDRVEGLTLAETTSGGRYPLAAQVEKGVVLGMRLITSANVDPTQAIALDAGALMLGLDTIEIESSANAAIDMGEGEVQSSFQTNSTAMRLIAPASWQQMRPSVFSVTGIGW